MGYGMLQQNNIDPEGSYCMTARTLYKKPCKICEYAGKRKNFSHHPNSSIQRQVCLAWRHTKFAKVTNRLSDTQSPRNQAGRLSVAGTLTHCVCLPDHKRCKSASGMRQAGDNNGKQEKKKTEHRISHSALL